MRYEHFNMRDHGFAGHLAEPDQGSDRAVIIVMGGEQSQNPLRIVFYEFEYGNIPYLFYNDIT